MNLTMLEFTLFPTLFFIVLLIIFSPLILALLLIRLQKPVQIFHPATGMVKSGYVGYSWTYLAFGWLVPIFRGEISIGLMHLAIYIVTFGFSQLILPFLYNRQYMTRMLTSGWQLDRNDVNYGLACQKLNIYL